MKARRGVRNAKRLAKNYLYTYITCSDSGILIDFFYCNSGRCEGKKNKGETILLA